MRSLISVGESTSMAITAHSSSKDMCGFVANQAANDIAIARSRISAISCLIEPAELPAETKVLVLDLIDAALESITSAGNLCEEVSDFLDFMEEKEM